MLFIYFNNLIFIPSVVLFVRRDNTHRPRSISTSGSSSAVYGIMIPTTLNGEPRNVSVVSMGAGKPQRHMRYYRKATGRYRPPRYGRWIDAFAKKLPIQPRELPGSQRETSRQRRFARHFFSHPSNGQRPFGPERERDTHTAWSHYRRKPRRLHLSPRLGYRGQERAGLGATHLALLG